MASRGVLRFFNETAWTEKIEALPWYKRPGYRVGRIVHIMVKGFQDEHLNLQAAALTYVSFLSIIPIMAVLFSLAKGFGFQGKVEPLIRDALKLVDPEILDKIITYVSDTNVAALGTMGFLFLLWAILKTLLNLEKSFNLIWAVQRSRPLHRALAYYICVIIIVPILVAASSTLMAMMHTNEGGWLEAMNVVPGAAALFSFFKDVLPFAITWVAFSLVYTFMVNTRVRFLAALGGAFVTSLLWNLLQWIYIETQVGLSKNAIYGTFAFLPVFLVYLYLSWLILLFGCRIAFALQNEEAYRRTRMAHAAGARHRISSGLQLLYAIGNAFSRGEKIDQPADLADRLDLPQALIHDMSERLIRADILRRLAGDDVENPERAGLVPARALHRIAVSEVIGALEDDDGTVHLTKAPASHPVEALLIKAEQARDSALQGVMVSDLFPDRTAASNEEE